MDRELNGKTALITGASRGIGAATALCLARHGVSRFLLHYGGYREGAIEVQTGVREAGADAETIQADLATSDGIHAFVSELKKRNLPVDILVNNAGSLVQRAKLHEFTEDLFDRVVNLNAKSAWFITQLLAPSMVERGGGVIVNVSSIAARNGGGPGATIYAASKAMISAITKGLAKELAPKGVRVNAVSPGTVDNHFHATFSNPQMLEAMRAWTPTGALGTNEEVADLIYYLCSDGARYIHGQTIEINGGMFMV